MMFKFNSDVLIYGCMITCQHRGTRLEAYWKPYWLRTRARYSSLFDNKEGIRRLSLQLAWHERENTLSSIKNIFVIIFTCVYLKGMRVLNAMHWEGQTSDIWDVFFVCLLQTFLMNILSGVKEGCHLCSDAFCYQRNKKLELEDVCCAGCRKQILQFNTSCCYLFGKNTSAVYISMMLDLTSLVWWDVTGKPLILSDNIKRWNENQKHYHVCMLKYSGAPRHT